MSKYLGIYLNDHLAGATGAIELTRRAAGQYEDSELGTLFSRIGAEIQEDRATLEAILARTGIQHQRHKHAAAWVVEKLGRLKFNGALLRRSPLSPFVELETLAVGIHGKLLLWRALQAAPPDAETAAQVDYLIERAEQQLADVERSRIETGRRALGHR